MEDSGAPAPEPSAAHPVSPLSAGEALPEMPEVMPPKAPRPRQFSPEFRKRAREAQQILKIRRMADSFANRPTWQRRLLTILIVLLLADFTILTHLFELICVSIFDAPGWGNTVGTMVAYACLAGIILVLTLHGPWLLFKKARVSLVELFIVLNVLGVLFGFGAQFIQEQHFRDFSQNLWAYGIFFVVSVNWVMRGTGWGFWVATVLEITKPKSRFGLALLGMSVPAFVIPFVVLTVGVNGKQVGNIVILLWLCLTLVSVFSFLSAREYHRLATQKETNRELERELLAMKEKRSLPKEAS